MDFYNLNKKIYIEIDGEQHYVDKKIEKSDKTRNQYFKNLGWIGLRIRWSFYQTLKISEKYKIINAIKQFLLNKTINIKEFKNILLII